MWRWDLLRAIAVLSNCILTGNSAYIGGGAWAYFGGTRLYNCALSGNSAQLGMGGGAYGGTLYNCALTGNSSDFGGGISDARLYNCTLTGNSASGSHGLGGGANRSKLYNCTLTGNSATEGGGAYHSTLDNSIIYYNTAPTGPTFLGKPTELLLHHTLPRRSGQYYRGAAVREHQRLGRPALAVQLPLHQRGHEYGLDDWSDGFGR